MKKSSSNQLRINRLRELCNLLREDWTMNDKSWLRPGCQAMVTHRFGVWQMGIGSPFIRFFTRNLYHLMHTFVRNFYGIELYATTKIGRRLRIAHQSGIIVHPFSSIGDDCLIRQGVSIGRGPNHGGGTNAAAPTLGNRVEIGANAVLIGGITIGDDVVIGPGAVVMRNIPSGSIVASPPARIMPRLRPPPDTETPNF